MNRPHRAWLLVTFIALIPVYAPAPRPGRLSFSRSTPRQKIIRAYRRGRLTYEQSLIQRVLAVCEPDKVDPRFRSSHGRVSRCGTPVFQELAHNWTRLSRPTQQLLAGYRARPTDPSATLTYDKTATVKHFDSPGGHFRIHYVTSTVDAPAPTDADHDGTPDFVQHVADAFDASWHRYIVELGFDQPLSDFPGPGGAEDGGDGRYDVYLAETVESRQILGLEVTEFECTTCVRNAATSYILFDNDFEGSGFQSVTPLQLMQVTAAHEFLHAIQSAYETDDQYLPSGMLNFWYSEATSAWGEKQVYPEVDAILERLPGWFEFPEVALDAFGPDVEPQEHEYGSMLINELLSLEYGPETVRRVWETMSRHPDGTDLNSIQALDAVLHELGGSRSAVMRDFFFYNYLTGSNDDGRHYPEAAKYPDMFVSEDHTHSTYPAHNPSPLPYPPAHLASNYIAFLPPAGKQATDAGAVDIEFDGQDDAEWSAQLVAVTTGPSPVYLRLPIALEAKTQAGSRVVDWSGLSRIMLIVGVLSTEGADFHYTYTATLVDTAAPKVASSTATATTIEIAFDAPLQPETATQTENYRVESPPGTPVALSDAALSYNGAIRTVRLDGLTLTPGAEYKVTITGVQHADTGAPIVADGTGNVATGTVDQPATGRFLLQVEGGHDEGGNALYDLIAVPMTLTDPNPATHLGADTPLATYDPRLTATCGDYTCFDAQAPNFDLEPGRGYFIQSTSDRLIPFRGGTLVDPRQPFPVDLPANGWYLFGNPFPAPLEWNLDAIRYRLASGSEGTLRDAMNSTAPPLEPYAWVWDTGEQRYRLLFDKSFLPETRSVLRPGEGAFVRSNTTGVRLVLPANPSAKARAARPFPGGWRARLMARCGASVSSEGYFGVAPPGLTRGLQLSSPPPVATARDFVQLLFCDAAPNRTLAVDLKPTGVARLRWRLVVTTNRPESEVVLSWPRLSSLPANVGVRLIDEQTGRRQSLRSSQYYRFRSGKGVSSRWFTLEAYRAQTARLTISGVTFRTTRAAPTVSFVLSNAAEVQVRLVTPAGRVATVSPAVAATPGLNTVALSARAVSGAALPTGVYLVEIVARADDGHVAKAVRAMRIR